MTALPFLILIPLLAALAVLLGAPARLTSRVAAALNVALVFLELYTYKARYSHGYHHKLFDLVPSINLGFIYGADALSLMMVTLTALVTLSAIFVTPAIESGEDGFYACLLFISAGAMGAFLSFDLFFFYIFHELALIPTFLLIGIWGHGENRVAAAWKITIYLAVGSFILLLALVGLYLSVAPMYRTFDITQLQHLATLGDKFNPAMQNWVFPLMLLGFGILISLFPFHTWAPAAYAAAPTPAAMLHSGVLKKFGLYGLLRLAVPLLPLGMQHWMNVFLVLLVGNILYVGYVTIAQKRLDMMLGYSSVMHMGYIFLGISSLNVIGLTGASMMMFAHGLSIAVLFAVAGEIRARTGTMRLDELGGLARTAPFLALAFGMAMFASIGLPGFANFASEVMVFFGAFGYEAFGHDTVSLHHFNGHQIATICALWGVVLSAVYMLRAYRRVFLGARQTTTAPGDPAPIYLLSVTDPASSATRWALILLVVGLIVMGVRPSMIVNPVKRVVRSGLQAPVIEASVTPSTVAASRLTVSTGTAASAVTQSNLP